MIGAVLNLILDPIFIYGFGWGVEEPLWLRFFPRWCPAVWVLAFLCGKKAILRLRPAALKPKMKLMGQILSLGLSGFTQSVTNSVVQIFLQRVLQF